MRIFALVCLCVAAACAGLTLGACSSSSAPAADLGVPDVALDALHEGGGADCAIDGNACFSFEPSNVGSRLAFDEAGGDLLVGDDRHVYWHLDTGTGQILAYDAANPAVASVRTVRPAGFGKISGITFAQLSQSGEAGALAVFSVAAVRVGAAASLIGRGPLPLVLFAAGEIRIEGLISVAADAVAGQPGPGPGGATGRRAVPGAGAGGGGYGALVGPASGGGGGASFGGLGGHGRGGMDSGAAAGAPYGGSRLVPLIAGSAGGAGRANASSDGRGGHGGGALQLVSRLRIEVTGTGRLDAAGGGGAAGNTQLASQAGGGGGSGGALLVEAPTVILTGLVGANGGSGGSAGVSGTAGDPAIIPAPSAFAGVGSDQSGRAGDAPASGGTGGSGGGGGGGRIRINTRTGTERYVDGVSPNHGELLTVGQLK